MFKLSYWKIFAGLALFFIVLTLPPSANLSPEGQKMAGIAVLMSFFWVTEAIPISATALLPLALFPLLGVMNSKDASAPYANHLIYLFMGGFLIAVAMQRWNLHRRIAMRTVMLVGFSPAKLVLGFMIATAFLSLWMSNTACAMIMTPIGIAVAEHIHSGDASAKKTGFGTALMLGIAYSASIGGIGTLIGTPPNIVLANVAEEMCDVKVGFVDWMKVGVPFVIIMIPLTWFYLTRIAFKLPKRAGTVGKEVIEEELRALGKMSFEEKTVAIVFAVTVFLWIFTEPKEFGAFTIPGVQTFFPKITDATIAMFSGILLFFLPAKSGEKRRILTWKEAKEIPWGVLILFGGGLALAEGFKTTGLADWIGSCVGLLSFAPHFVLTTITISIVIFLTEVTSNTATTAMILPVLAGVARGVGMSPLMLMIPATISASCAFMLPAGTPPNAIIFSSGYVTIPQMAKVGLVMNLMGIVLITMLAYLVVGKVF
jgi:sodium-dependent dicarboxylate transporter 2/3/5